MVELQPGPAWEVTPELRADCIVLNLIKTSAMMAEPAAMRGVHLEAASGSPPVEPADKDSVEDTKRELFRHTAQRVQRPVGVHVSQARGEPPKPPPGEKLARVNLGALAVQELPNARLNFKRFINVAKCAAHLWIKDTTSAKKMDVDHLLVGVGE